MTFVPSSDIMPHQATLVGCVGNSVRSLLLELLLLFRWSEFKSCRESNNELLDNNILIIMNDHYPNLSKCKVELRSGNVSSPPVRLPANVLQLVEEEVPTAYDFAVEKEVLQEHKDRMANLQTLESDNPEDLQKAILVRLKSVTNADQEVCVALLESNSYDLSTSVEAFYQGK